MKLDLFEEKKAQTCESSPSQDNAGKLKDQVLRVVFLEQVKGRLPAFFSNFIQN